MILRIDMASETPIYVQLRNQIVLGIGRGELQLGEGLPTVRQLAQDIGVNTMTVKPTPRLKTKAILKSTAAMAHGSAHPSGSVVNFGKSWRESLRF